jgi:hypothetical protein
MEPFAERMARIASRHPLPALPLQEVRHLLRRDTPGPPPDEGFLLGWLERRPDLFRILDPWQGAWRSILDVRPEDGARYLPYLREQGISPRWPWVVTLLVEGPGWSGGVEGPPRTRGLARMRDSLLALSREIDGDSVPELTRWCRIIREQRDLLAKLDRPGGGP